MQLHSESHAQRAAALGNAGTSPSRPVVMVTGGSRGIGHDICIAAAEAGWDVAFTYQRDSQAAMDTVAAIQAAGAEGAAFQADMGNQFQVRTAFAGAWDRFQRLNGLVNNAGVLRAPSPVTEVSEDLLLDSFRVNVFGLFYATAEAVKQMSVARGHRGGVIVNLSSAAARTGGMPHASPYAACKGAVDSFTLSMARELAAQGIRVNAVRPGLIATEMHDVHGGLTALGRHAATVPLERAGTAEEVASVVVFLMGQASRYMHGALVDVTGGR